MQRRGILLSPQCGDTTSCTRHLVSDMRLSLMSKENVHNVRSNQLPIVNNLISEVLIYYSNISLYSFPRRFNVDVIIQLFST